MRSIASVVARALWLAMVTAPWLAIVTQWSGCGEPACPLGSETCACTGGGACDPGLVCRSGLCVEGDPDGGPPDAGRADGGLDAALDDGGGMIDGSSDAPSYVPGNACLSIEGSARFCGLDCSGGAPCPAGATCREVPVPGGLARQCIPDAVRGGATCPTTDWDRPAAYCIPCDGDPTPCMPTGDQGFCAGTACTRSSDCTGGASCVMVRELCFGPVCGESGAGCAALEATDFCAACDVLGGDPIDIACGG